MTAGLFRLTLPDGRARLAIGDPETGPERLMAADLTIERLLAGDGRALIDALATTAGDPAGDPVPEGSIVVAPVDTQEVWASGVTYRRSRDARKHESSVADVYDRVYEADRPELFFKAPGWRVGGPGAEIGIRADSEWDVPEPELALVIAADGTIVGRTIGNDMSSRSIEGENPLYLPQAKSYDRSCALGPCIVAYDPLGDPSRIRLVIARDGAQVVDLATSTAEITRTFESLAEHLFRALEHPAGAVLLTGTGAVPPETFTLRPGDEVTISIDGIGRLTNRVVQVGGSAVARA